MSGWINMFRYLEDSKSIGFQYLRGSGSYGSNLFHRMKNVRPWKDVFTIAVL